MIGVVDCLEQSLHLSQGPPVHGEQKHDSGQGASPVRNRNPLKRFSGITPCPGARVLQAPVVEPPGLTQAGDVAYQRPALFRLGPGQRRLGVFLRLEIAVLQIRGEGHGRERGDELGLLGPLRRRSRRYGLLDGGGGRGNLIGLLALLGSFPFLFQLRHVFLNAPQVPFQVSGSVLHVSVALGRPARERLALVSFACSCQVLWVLL